MMNLNEQEKILLDFKNSYEDTKDVPRVVYGIGLNTKYILENIEGYNIIGLMDKENEGKSIYNLPVYSQEDILNKIDVKEIIVICRFSILNIIYQRIKNLEESKILIKNINGDNLNKLFSDDNNSIDYEYHQEDELLQKINDSSVISFDVFNTLLNRLVLRPENIFDLIEIKLKKENIIDAFKLKRLQAEQEAVNKYGNVVTFEQIYEMFQNITNLSVDICNYIKKCEIEMEFKNIVPRKSAVEYFELAKRLNKPIYILSDMYFDKSIIKELLLKNGITGYVECIVSSDYVLSKEDGQLFEILKNKVSEKFNTSNILHIGDNLKADIENAKRYDIDTFYFISYYDMIINSSFNILLSHVENITDSVFVACIFSKLFDSPFILNKYNGKFYIENVYDFAHLFLIPMITKFMAWKFSLLKNYENSVILYVARDGYLINEMHKELAEYLNIKVKSHYFLGSRRGVVVPNISNIDDIIRQIDNINNEDYSVILKERLGIDFIKPDGFENLNAIERKEIVKVFLIDNQNTILNNSKNEKSEYLNYIKKFELDKYDNIFIFDLAPSGTIHNHLSKLLDKKLTTISFATLNLNNEQLGEFYSMYGNSSGYDNNSLFFFKSFTFFEKVLSSHQGQFINFVNEKPQFRECEHFSNEFILLQEYLKNNVIDLLLNFDLQFLTNLNLKLVDTLYYCVSNKFTIINPIFKDFFSSYAPIFNRFENVFDFVNIDFEKINKEK